VGVVVDAVLNVTYLWGFFPLTSEFGNFVITLIHTLRNYNEIFLEVLLRCHTHNVYVDSYLTHLISSAVIFSLYPYPYPGI
jgi:hypothetical protein